MTINPNDLTHEELEIIKEEEWQDDPNDDPIFREMCRAMRSMGPEEFRAHLLLEWKG